LNSSLAQSAAEFWLAKFAMKGQIMPLLKSFVLGQKLGFWPICLATNMVATQSRAP